MLSGKLPDCQALRPCA